MATTGKSDDRTSTRQKASREKGRVESLQRTAGEIHSGAARDERAVSPALRGPSETKGGTVHFAPFGKAKPFQRVFFAAGKAAVWGTARPSSLNKHWER